MKVNQVKIIPTKLLKGKISVMVPVSAVRTLINGGGDQGRIQTSKEPSVTKVFWG